MKALTVYQPFATLLVCKYANGDRPKRFETRPNTCTWLGYRGEVAIHAGKSQGYMHLCDQPLFRRTLARCGLGKYDLVFGAIIGKVEMAQFLRTEDMRRAIFEEEAEFGNFAPGRVAIHMKYPVMFNMSIPVRGQQGLWWWEP